MVRLRTGRLERQILPGFRIGVHPAKLIAGLVRMADDAGAELTKGANAQTIDEPNGRLRVMTSARQVAADQVCLMERSDG